MESLPEARKSSSLIQWSFVVKVDQHAIKTPSKVITVVTAVANTKQHLSLIR